MDSDRELLEKAAKAAGLDEVMCPDGWTDDGPWRWYEQLKWNPLTDDGDALRLATDCRLTVCTDGHATVSACEAYCPETGAFVTQRVSDCADKQAAVRRAIVRAAAAMGDGNA